MPRSKQPFTLTDKLACAVRAQAEVARIMSDRGYPMNRANVWHIERRALRKMREGLAEFYNAYFSTE
jgi:hypothetical protein